MTYCITCGHHTHPAAPCCPQCGVGCRHAPVAPVRSSPSTPDTLWVPYIALVCGLLSVGSLLSPTPWTGLQTLAAGTLMVAAIAIGCIAVARQERGQALAMAGVALGAVGLMGALANMVSWH